MDYLDTYIETLEITGEYSDNTVQAYASDLKRFFLFLKKKIGRIPVSDDLDSSTIKDFLESENRTGLSASTLHRRKVVLTRFALYLVNIGVFSRNDVLELFAWKQELWKDIYTREVQYLTDTQVEKLIATVAEENSPKSIRDTALLSLLLETGLPIGKLISINLSDIDLTNKRLNVTFDHGNYSYPIENSIDPLKVYMTSARKEYIQSDLEEALFISQMGGRISRQGVWQLVREWGERAKINTPISPRILRNTKVKRMVKAGLSTADIQRELGHSNRYSTRALIRKLNRRIG